MGRIAWLLCFAFGSVALSQEALDHGAQGGDGTVPPDKPTQALIEVLGKGPYEGLDSAIQVAMANRLSDEGTEQERDRQANFAIQDALLGALESKKFATDLERAAFAVKLRGLLEAKYKNGFFWGEKGPFPRILDYEPIAPEQIPAGVHFGPAGLTEMNIRNETGLTLKISGHFSPVRKGDFAVTDAAEFRKAKRGWIPMRFDASDTPTKESKPFSPTGAENPVKAVIYPPGTGLHWMKRGPGPVFLEITTEDGKRVPDIEVVFDMKDPKNQRILVRKK